MDEAVYRKIKHRTIKGVIQAVILFGALFGISFLQGTAAGRTAFLHAAGFSILMIFGYTLNKLFNETGEKGSLARFYPAGTAAGMLLGGLGLWLLLISFDPFRFWPGRFALTLLCGIIGLATARLAIYGEGRVQGFWGEFLHWLKGLPSLKFLFGILIGLYLVYIRPYLTFDSVTLMLAEWGIFCLLTGTILVRVWIGLTHTHLNEETGLNWRKHRLRIERLAGTIHDYMTRMERQFITGGDPIGLYVLLITQLDENQVDEQDITRALQPLIDFSGINELRQNYLQLTGFTRSRQIEKRLAVLKTVYERVETAAGLVRKRTLPQHDIQEEIQPSQDIDTSIQALEQRFLKQGEKSGLLVRLTLLLHRSGRRREHVIWTLRSLTDEHGKPVNFELRKLLTQVYEPASGNNTAEK